MNPRTTILAALLGGAFLPGPATPTTPTAPPVPGPGGVAATVKTFLERLDAGADFAALLVDREHAVGFTVDAEGRLQSVGSPTTATFVDVDRDGSVIAATGARAFAKALAAGVGPTAARSVRTEIRSLRADCDSERCSLALVAFDRVFGEGEAAVRVPMRATALLQWERTKGADFRIWHWHASPAGASAAAPAEAPAGRRGG